MDPWKEAGRCLAKNKLDPSRNIVETGLNQKAGIFRMIDRNAPALFIFDLIL